MSQSPFEYNPMISSGIEQQLVRNRAEAAMRMNSEVYGPANLGMVERSFQPTARYSAPDLPPLSFYPNPSDPFQAIEREVSENFGNIQQSLSYSDPNYWNDFRGALFQNLGNLPGDAVTDAEKRFFQDARKSWMDHSDMSGNLSDVNGFFSELEQDVMRRIATGIVDDAFGKNQYPAAPPYPYSPAASGPGDQSGSASQTPADSSGTPSNYPPAANDSSSQSLLSNARIVAQVAQQDGIDPATAIATMLAESGGQNTAIGDGGTSFGLFQLHEGGELGNLSEAQAFDPATNAQVALAQFAQNKGEYSDPGQLAAASQRPADPASYAATVDSLLPQAQQLLAEINQAPASANAAQAPAQDYPASVSPSSPQAGAPGADQSGFSPIDNPTAQALQAAGLGGQCTYWAALHHPTPWVNSSTPGLVGNAGQWYGEAQAAGVQTTDAGHPVAGAIACFSGQYGHVAIVKSVNSDGSFVVTEMNVVDTDYGHGSGIVDTRTIQPGDPSLQGFIVGTQAA